MCALSLFNRTYYKMRNCSLDNIFLIAFAIYLCSVLAGSTVLLYIGVYETAFSMIRYVSYTLLVIKIVIDWKNGAPVSWISLLLGIVSIVDAFIIGARAIFFVYLFLMAARNVSFKKIIKIAIIIYSVSMVLVVMLSSLNIFEDITSLRPDLTVRHALGFTYYSTPANFYLLIILMAMYLLDRKIKIIELLGLEFINLLMFFLTDARTGYILTTFALLMLFTINNGYANIAISKFKKILNVTVLKYAAVIYTVFISLIGIIFSVIYNNNNIFLVKINSILSGRLLLGNEGIKNFGISIFGHNIEWIGWKEAAENNAVYNIVDCSYLKIILDFGIIVFIFAVVGYCFALCKAIDKRKIKLIVILSLILFQSLIEPRLLEIRFNIFLLLFAQFLDYKEIKIFSYSAIKLFVADKIIRKKLKEKG